MNNTTSLSFSAIFPFYMGAIIPIGMVTNVLSLIYTVIKLKISPHIKKILIVECIYNLGCSVLMATGYFMTVISDQRTLRACAALVAPFKMSFSASMIMSTMIGAIRYYMAERTGQTRMIKHNYIKTFTILIFGLLFGFHLAFVVRTFTLDLPDTNFIFLCANISRSPKTWFATIFQVIHIPIMAMGLGLNFAMIRFIHKQNNLIQPLKMVAWSVPVKTSSQKSEDYLKDTVPVISSTLSFSSFLLFGLVQILNHQITDQVSTRIEIVAGFVSLRLAFHLPMVLGFTMKSQDKKKNNKRPKPCPPRGLQYHEKTNEEET